MFNPVGEFRKEYKIKDARPKLLSQEEIDNSTLSQVKVYLRSLPKQEGETFPWPLVEKTLKEPMTKRGLSIPPSDLPEPQEGYQWHWVDDMANLSGIGGWLEIDIKNKKQGRFKLERWS